MKYKTLLLWGTIEELARQLENQLNKLNQRYTDGIEVVSITHCGTTLQSGCLIVTYLI